MNPIDLNTPYSQIFSRTFYRVETSSKKKTRVREIKAINAINRLNTSIEASRLAISSGVSINTVIWSVNVALIPLARNCRYSVVQLLVNLT